MLASSSKETAGAVRFPRGQQQYHNVPQSALPIEPHFWCVFCAVVSNGFDKGGGKVFKKVFDNGEIVVEELPIDTTLRPLSSILTQPDLLSL